MWQNIPLNLKITFSLLFIQATTLAAGGFFLQEWVSRSRIEELRSKLDLQSDAVESGLFRHGELISLQNDNEAVRELNHDRNFYFWIYSRDKTQAIESSGPQAALRRELKSKISLFRATPSSNLLATSSGYWLVQVEAWPSSHDSSKVQIAVALNAQPLLDELSRFKRAILLSALGIFVLSTLASGTVVSLTTKNLKNFSKNVEKLKPPFDPQKIAFAPQSREERLLLRSYYTLMDVVQTSYRDQRLFIANASHELKTPIAASLSALETLLAKSRTVAEYRETCTDVLKEMQVLRRLSFALLSLTSNDLAKFDVTESCAIVQVLHELLPRWNELAQNQGIRITENIDAENKVTVLGNAQQWETIVGNLIDNAVKYNKDGGTIRIEVHCVDGMLAIRIEDTGIGMTKEQINLLGNLFFRADQSRKSNNSFGLGFALVKSTLNRLGGTLEVKSEAGVGTSVQIKIPTETV